MRPPHVDDSVRLIHDLPELMLSAGAVGVVCSTWFAPDVAYEVEFQDVGEVGTRVLLRNHDVQLLDESDELCEAGAGE
jgi:hypothetical protein